MFEALVEMIQVTLKIWIVRLVGGQEEGAKKNHSKSVFCGDYVCLLWCRSWNPGLFFLFGLAAGFRLPEWPSGLQPPGSRLLWKEVEVASERVWGSPVFLLLFVLGCFFLGCRFVQQSRSLEKLLPGNSGGCDQVQTYSWKWVEPPKVLKLHPRTQDRFVARREKKLSEDSFFSSEPQFSWAASAWPRC